MVKLLYLVVGDRHAIPRERPLSTNDRSLAGSSLSVSSFYASQDRLDLRFPETQQKIPTLAHSWFPLERELYLDSWIDIGLQLHYLVNGHIFVS